MCCFVILLLSNEMQMSVRRFSAIPHLRGQMVTLQSHILYGSTYLYLCSFYNGVATLPPIGHMVTRLLSMRDRITECPASICCIANH